VNSIAWKDVKRKRGSDLQDALVAAAVSITDGVALLVRATNIATFQWSELAEMVMSAHFLYLLND